MVERMDKINELVKNSISIILREIFPDEIISVTQVEVSKDLSYAKVWISALQDVDTTVKQCKQNASDIRSLLSQKAVMRRTPYLNFVADKTGESADKIDKLLKEIKKDK